MLGAREVPYRVFELPSEKHSALETAKMLGVPPEHVYKTIVITRVIKGKPILAVVPGPSEVDLKSLAKVFGEKKLVITTQKEAERITRAQAGGISPLALINRGFQVVVDRSAETLGEIYVSGGRRGINICLSTEALVKLTNAIIATICH